MEESDSKRRKELPTEDELKADAKTTASYLLTNMVNMPNNMLLSISIDEFMSKQKTERWKKFQHDSHESKITNKRFIYSLFNDSNGKLVCIIINVPGFLLYPFKIVSLPSQ